MKPGRMGVFGRIKRAFVEGQSVLGTAFRGVVTNRLRAFLSTLGVAIGVATLMVIYAMVQGLTASFTEQISAMGSNTLYLSSRPWGPGRNWFEFRNRPPVTRADVAALREHADKLIAIAPLAFNQTDVSYRGDAETFVPVRGTSSEYIDTANVKIEAGRFLSPVDTELGANVVVIGSEIRDRFFRHMEPIGAPLHVGSQRFTVIGVLKQQGTAFGQSQDRVVIIPLEAFGKMFGRRRDLAVAMMAAPEQLNQAEEQIIEVLRRHRGLKGEEENNFAINRQEQLQRMFNEQTQALFGVALAIGLITLIVGGIGVMNIMLVAVTERTREIGVRRAVGARRRTILFQFLLEASMVTLMGGAVGTALGLGGARILAIITPVSAKATPQAALLGLVFSAAVGLVFGTWPAWRAAQLDPIESLRYE